MMRVGEKEIPDQLFWEYIMAVCEMTLVFGCQAAGMMALDTKRAKLHDQVLDVAKVSRDDKKFKFALAMVVDDEVSLMQGGGK